MTARANGDPASHVLLAQRLFLPLGAPIDPDVAKRLDDLLEAADDSDFPIRVALIAAPTDLGTAFTLYEKPQEYAEFLGVELSFAYSDRLLVVMPNGFGFAVDGEPDEQAARVLRGVAAPGRDATKQARTATVAVRRLASAAGHRFDTAGGSVNRDRILIAATALLGVTVLAALMLYHRKSRTLST
jgi:hypothetical protein